MINGVDINDNLFAQPQNLFIEDAIEETQVLTSGISAEYGRFTGGVVNAITKSGGNTFSGSGRVNLLNPAWTTETPFEVLEAAPTHHAISCSETLRRDLRRSDRAGSAVVLHRRAAMRNVDNQATLPQTGYRSADRHEQARRDQDHRHRGARPHDSGRLSEQPAHAERTTPGFRASSSIRTARSIAAARTGTTTRTIEASLRNNVLVEAQYSERRFQFARRRRHEHEHRRLAVHLASAARAIYNAPYFDATDPEDRNNRQLTGSVTNYWNAGGRHETKGGYEWFRSQRTGGNSQSSTLVRLQRRFRDQRGRRAACSTRPAG